MADPKIRYDILANAEGGAEVERLALELGKLDKAVDPATAQRAQALATELRELGAQTAAIARFRELKDGVETARVALDGAQAAAQKLAQELSAVEAPTRAQVGQMQKLGDAVRAAKTELQGQTAALDGARANLSDLGVATTKLASSEIELRQALQSTRQEVAALGQQQQAVQRFTELAAATDKARSALAEADTAVETFRSELSSAGGVTEQSARQLAALTEAARQAQVAYQRQAVTQAEAGTALRAAGVDTDKLVAAQQRAVTASNASTTSAERLAAAYRAADAAINSAFGQTGVRSLEAIRTESLAVEQAVGFLNLQLRNGAISAQSFERGVAGARLRLHELQVEASTVPAVPGAFAQLSTQITGIIGKFGALAGAIAGIGFAAKPIFDLAVQTDTLRRALTTVTGSAENANRQIDFLKNTAQQAGVSVSSISDAYLQFVASARSAGIEADVVNKVFAATAGAAGNLGLSGEKVTRVLEALGQMAGKGVVSMEELRQQLGDSLPGAVALLAKGLGLTQAELIKLVESGNLLSRDALPALANALGSLGAKGAQVEGLSASFNRLKNVVTEAGQELIDGPLGQGAGFLFTALGGVLRDITVIAVGFNQALNITGRTLALLAAAATGNIASFQQFKTEFGAILDESTEKIDKFKDRAYASGEAAKQAGSDAAAGGKQVAQAGAAYTTAAGAAGTAAAAHAQAGAAATQSGAAHDALGGQTQKAAGAATNASVSWAKLTVDYGNIVNAIEQQLKVSEKLVKAKEDEGAAAVELVKIGGNELEILRAEAFAAAGVASARADLSAKRQLEVAVLKAQLEAETTLARQLGDPDGTREKQIIAIQKSIEAKTAEAAASKALNDSAQIEATTRLLAIQTYGDQSAKLGQLRDAYDQANLALSRVIEAEKAGLATKDEVVAATRRQAAAEALYHDALDDTVKALERKADRIKQDAALTEAGLNLQKSQIEAQIDLAKLNGNSYEALQLTIKLKENEIELSEAKIAAVLAETKATIASAEASKVALEAEGKLTVEKKAQIEATIKSAEVKLLEAKAAGANVDVLKKQLENLRLYGTEAGRATTASGKLGSSFDGLTASGKAQAAQSILQKIALGEYITKAEATILANTHLVDSFNSLADAARNATVKSNIGSVDKDGFATDASGGRITINGEPLKIPDGYFFDKAAYDRDAANVFKYGGSTILDPNKYVKLIPPVITSPSTAPKPPAPAPAPGGTSGKGGVSGGIGAPPPAPRPSPSPAPVPAPAPVPSAPTYSFEVVPGGGLISQPVIINVGGNQYLVPTTGSGASQLLAALESSYRAGGGAIP